MNSKKVVILSGLAILIMAATQIVFAEEPTVAPADPALITSNQQMASQKESDIQWAWGEVTNLDSQAGIITLKYLDYETDQEKELALVVDEKTTFENIADFNGLRLKDTLSIDYMVGADNKNIAKNISFEKPEEASSVSVPAAENSQLATTPPPIIEQPVVDATAPASVAPAAPVVPVAPVASEPAAPAAQE